MRRLILIVGAALAIEACAAKPVQPAVDVRYQTVVRTVQAPCPGPRPHKPAPLARPLPSSPRALIDVLTSKLEEWAGKGEYGDQSEAVFDRCLTK